MSGMFQLLCQFQPIPSVKMKFLLISILIITVGFMGCPYNIWIIVTFSEGMDS
jgi:hypothetical protein